jgi:hypothetical protein
LETSVGKRPKLLVTVQAIATKLLPRSFIGEAERSRLAINKASTARHHPHSYFSLRNSPLRLEGLVGTFGYASDVALAATSARGACHDFRHRPLLRLRHYDGSRGLLGPSTSPPTSLSPLLQLEGLAGTFSFTSDVALAATSARGARRDLRLCL